MFQRAVQKRRSLINLKDLKLKQVAYFAMTILNQSHGAKLVHLQADWLYLSPDLWPSNECFQEVKDFVSNLKVVNDTAERGLKVNQDYAAILTENEVQRISLLQIVEKHRKEFPIFGKSTLSQT